MLLRQTGVILKGIVGGAVVGLFLGIYVVGLTTHYVIQRSEYSYPLLYENAQGRYFTTVLLCFVIIFSVVGPFVASASFGPWLRHAVYGLVGCIALVVGVALVGAAIQSEQPFHKNKLSGRTCIDAARLYGIPASFVIGPLAGILIGGNRNKSMEIKSNP
ncbi:MAG: hypothetical protein P1V19_09535 [Gimesia sp.]|nr:hypothetical protein [Gimesia sp.]